MKLVYYLVFINSLCSAFFFSPTLFGSEFDFVVAPDGRGDFTSIQKAIDAAPQNSERITKILIKRGNYNTEKLIIPSDKKNVILLGESREETIISYHIYDCSSGKCPANDAAKWTGDNIRTSATLTILGDGFRAENLTIQNSAGPVGQAQAITVLADKVVFINCNLKGYQDTIYLWSIGKRSYFGNCLIIGRTDYIYGSGIGYFDMCEIRSWGGGWITAPATPKEQLYGFVFNKCKITYASNSPRAGDDGVKFRYGRPWHEYPKVAWLFCEISDMLNPQGWGDIWIMDYAATSADLHLFEYENSGPGANMSERAKWVGLRSLNPSESLNYTVQKVLSGADKWDPTAAQPLVKSYIWTGKAISNGWFLSENWNPAAIPASGETALIDGNFIVKASGNFVSDLTLKNSARIEISGKTSIIYLSAQGTQILALGQDTLSGKITVKDSVVFDISGKLSLMSNLSGVHKLVKKGTGTLILAGDNTSFTGNIEIHKGEVDAFTANSLGRGNVEVKSGAKLIVSNNSAFYPKSRLTVASGSLLELKKDLTTSEFFIGNTIQLPAEYTSVSNPGLITNSGKIILGRPSVFTFIGGANGNWDNPSHFSPALLPLAGETVICEREIETTSAIFTADIRIRGAGKLRLRGTHQSDGTIFMEDGTTILYNTSGNIMGIRAPIKIEGNVSYIMESSNPTGTAMKLEGTISGDGKISVLNNGKGIVNNGTLILAGNNSEFKGTWDLTKYSSKYPTIKGYNTYIEGVSEYAFGDSKTEAALKNKIILSHQRAAYPKLSISLFDSSRIVLNTSATVYGFLLNGLPKISGTYNATSNPSVFEGAGSLTVTGNTNILLYSETIPVRILENTIVPEGNSNQIVICNLLGAMILNKKNTGIININDYKPGIYILKYVVNGKTGVLKFVR